MVTFKIEPREETIAKYREFFIKKYENRAFNFEEALREFDKDPETFDMVFYTLADIVTEELNKHLYENDICLLDVDPSNHKCDIWGWFCKPGEYPKITF